MLMGLSGTIDTMALAMQQQEGWYAGTPSYRNNNPGNLTYQGQAGSIGADSQGFAIFPDYESGYAALLRQIQLDAGRGFTFYQMFTKYLGGDPYGPPVAPGGDPVVYATNVAAALGTTPDNTVAAALAGGYGGGGYVDPWVDPYTEPGGDWINQWADGWNGVGLALGAGVVLLLAMR